MPPADMDHPFSKRSVRTDSVNFPGADSDGHDRFFEARPGERPLATETEQGSVRHLEQATSQKERRVKADTRYIHSENMAHYREMGWKLRALGTWWKDEDTKRHSKTR